jgi:pyrroline-5-carboxylate reductase
MKVLFLGAGKMGSAILRGILGAGHKLEEIAIVEPHVQTRDALIQETGVQSFEDRGTALAWAEIVVLAVKPQTWSQLGPQMGLEAGQGKVFVSIMAGIGLEALEKALPGHGVIRTMPNLPLTLGLGAVGWCGSAQTQNAAQVIQNLFGSIGLTVPVSEAQMDALTGLSGSGPAFVFQMIEGLVQGGVLCGLTRPQAEDLAYQTFKGSLELWRQSGKHPGQLTAEVCSPGGTTIAGIQVMEDRGLRGILMQTVQAAAQRSAALGA